MGNLENFYQFSANLSEMKKMMRRILQQVSVYIDDLAHLVYPNICQNCSQVLVDGEEFLCIKCLNQLPLTMFHRIDPNPVEKKFFGLLPVEMAVSIFYYHKSNSVQKLLHKVKYKHKTKLCKRLGQIFASRLIDANYFNKIDIILPVPLHKSKLRRRGFNQCVIFAQELSELSGIVYSDSVLKRVKPGISQTQKGKYDRWKNTEGVFQCVEPEVVAGKNILLIDDVITTGSTLEACIKAILKTTDAKFSIATFAYAD